MAIIKLNLIIVLFIATPNGLIWRSAKFAPLTFFAFTGSDRATNGPMGKHAAFAFVCSLG
jgi:hypothetical protein